MKPFDLSKLPEMTASELERAWAKIDADFDGILSRMIEAGRGRELPTETLKKAQAVNADQLSKEYASNAEIRQAVAEEKRERMAWNGTLKPIKRR